MHVKYDTSYRNAYVQMREHSWIYMIISFKRGHAWLRISIKVQIIHLLVYTFAYFKICVHIWVIIFVRVWVYVWLCVMRMSKCEHVDVCLCPSMEAYVGMLTRNASMYICACGRSICVYLCTCMGVCVGILLNIINVPILFYINFASSMDYACWKFTNDK